MRFYFKKKKNILNLTQMTHHCAVGFDCMDLTPPSTGTATIRLSKGDGDDMAWLLYL